jgi:hypothetical protein
MKSVRVGYWIVTGLLSALMLVSAGAYLFKTAEVGEVFLHLGFPEFIVVPLAIAKILGVLAITLRRSSTLAEWAYAGFFFDFFLALGAHLNAGDREIQAVVIAIIALGASYWLRGRLNRA